MWVTVSDWMLVDDEPPRPVAGSMLRSVGVRIQAQGGVKSADSATPDGVVEVPPADGVSARVVRGAHRRSVYKLTGYAATAEDVWVGTGRRWTRKLQHDGAEFVLTAGDDQFQVHINGHAWEVVPDTRLTVTGCLTLIAEYEWDAYQLADTRGDWLVTAVVELRGGDIQVDLAHPPVG